MEDGVERDGSNLYTWKISGEFTNGTNILGLVFFAGKFLFILAKKVVIYVHAVKRHYTNTCNNVLCCQRICDIC